MRNYGHLNHGYGMLMHAQWISRVQFFVTPWIVAHQSPLSMGFFRQEYWSGYPCPPPGDLPDPGIKPVSFTSNLHWQAGSLSLYHLGSPYG